MELLPTKTFNRSTFEVSPQQDERILDMIRKESIRKPFRISEIEGKEEPLPIFGIPSIRSQKTIQFTGIPSRHRELQENEFEEQISRSFQPQPSARGYNPNIIEGQQQCSIENICALRGQQNEQSKAQELKMVSKSVGRLHIIYMEYSVPEPWKPYNTEEGTGSCWFIRLESQRDNEPTKYMVTCTHCIENSMEENGLFVQTESTGKMRIPVRVIAVIPEIDASVLEIIDQDILRENVFIPWALGDDKKLQTGDKVKVFGYPLGQEEVKTGISNVNGREDGRIQLDGSINKGNSGGPIVKDGKVVGWIISGVEEANAVSYAQGVSLLKVVLPTINKGIQEDPNTVQVIRSGSLGIRYFSASKDRLIAIGAREQSCSFDSPCNCETGIVIEWASRYSSLIESPFSVEPGDIICSVILPLEIDGQIQRVPLKVDNDGDVTTPWLGDQIGLFVILRYVPVPYRIGITVWKANEGRLIEGEIELRDTYVNGYFNPCHPFEKTPYEIFGGLVVSQMNQEVLSEFSCLDYCLTPGQKEEAKLIVVNVLTGSLFNSSREGNGTIREGDIIKRVNGFPVPTIQDYREALKHPYKGKYLFIELDRNRSDIVSIKSILRQEKVLINTVGFRASSVYKYFMEQGVEEQEKIEQYF